MLPPPARSSGLRPRLADSPSRGERRVFAGAGAGPAVPLAGRKEIPQRVAPAVEAYMPRALPGGCRHARDDCRRVLRAELQNMRLRALDRIDFLPPADPHRDAGPGPMPGIQVQAFAAYAEHAVPPVGRRLIDDHLQASGAGSIHERVERPAAFDVGGGGGGNGLRLGRPRRNQGQRGKQKTSHMFCIMRQPRQRATIPYGSLDDSGDGPGGGRERLERRTAIVSPGRWMRATKEAQAAGAFARGPRVIFAGRNSGGNST